MVDKELHSTRELLVSLSILLVLSAVAAFLQFGFRGINWFNSEQNLANSGIPVEWVTVLSPDYEELEFISGSQDSEEGIFTRHLKFRITEPATVKGVNHVLMDYFLDSGWADQTSPPETLELLEFNNKTKRELVRINMSQEDDKVVVEFTTFQNVE